MKQETVEVIEIWMPSKEGEAVMDGESMKLVAYIVGSVAIKLEDEWLMKRYNITKVEADRLIINS